MHYNGEIHLDDLGRWGICPDTIFIDIENFLEKGIPFRWSIPLFAPLFAFK